MIYLDNAATTPLCPAAKTALKNVLEVYGNPSSIHQLGQNARFEVEEARRRVAKSVNVRPEQIVFTSGGTEANVMAIAGCAAKGRVVCSAVEHPSVLRTVQAANGVVLPVDKNGIIDLDALQKELEKGGVSLVCAMMVNNETGVIQPIEKIVALCQSHAVPCHTDAVQAWGHQKVDFTALGVEMLSLSAHKVGGPKGAGALVLKNEVDINALLTGGGQERNRRAGTENMPGIVGMGAAAATLAEDYTPLNTLKTQLEDGLKKMEIGIKIVGEDAPRAPHICQFITPNLNGPDAVIALDLAGFAVSQGSACSSGRVEASHVLLAQGLGKNAGSGLRVSFGVQNTAQDVSAFLEAFAGIYNKLA